MISQPTPYRDPVDAGPAQTRPASAVARLAATAGLAVASGSAVFGIVMAVVDRDACNSASRSASAAARQACRVAMADGRSPASLLIFFAAGLSCAAVGAFLVGKRGSVLGYLLLAAGLSFTVGPAAGTYSFHAVTGGISWPGGRLAGWIELAVFNNPAVFVPFGLLLLLFPTGRSLSPRWSVMVKLLIAGAALSLVGVMAEPLRGSHWRDGLGGTVLAASDLIEIPALPLIGIGLISGIACLFARMRRSRGTERAQIVSFIRGASVLAALVAVAPFVFGSDLLSTAWPIAIGLAAAAVPLMLGVAVAAHGLHGLDRLVNRTAVYASVTAIVVALYVGVVSLVGSFLGAGEERLAAVAVTALVAVGLERVKSVVQRAVDRVLFGFTSEPDRAAAEVARGLADASGDRPVLGVLSEAVASSLRLPYVEIAPSGSDAGHSWGTLSPADADSLEHVDLTHAGSNVGRLSCVPRQQGGRLTAADKRALDTLAGPIAAAVHATTLAVALSRSRERLVEAQETEQHRIRRDLHDGLGPALTGIALGIGELEERVAVEADRSLLTRLREEADNCLGEIRRIAHDLQPLALTEHGLVGALRVQAERFSALGLTVQVAAEGESRIEGSAAERAVYRMAAEALNNVHRHARATTCSVRLRFGDEVELEVVDDGAGTADSGDGLGLRSIHERAREFNGRCSVQPAEGGGTRVHVVLPVPS